MGLDLWQGVIQLNINGSRRGFGDSATLNVHREYTPLRLVLIQNILSETGYSWLSGHIFIIHVRSCYVALLSLAGVYAVGEFVTCLRLIILCDTYTIFNAVLSYRGFRTEFYSINPMYLNIVSFTKSFNARN